MANIFGENFFSVSLVATSSLASSQFCFVAVDSSGGIALPTNGGPTVGVLQDKPAAGEPGSVALHGITQVQAGGTFAAGAYVSTDSSGRAIAVVTGDYYDGIALTAGALGSNAFILLHGKGSHL